MSLQQGRVGVRSIVTFRYVVFLRDFARYPSCFWGASSGQIPRPFPRQPGPARVGWCRFAAQRLSGASDGRPWMSSLADFLTLLEAPTRPAPGW